ncbi:hypothetical protein XM53_11680 [Roseovarius atlanticus]|uniref:Uncharacterized protein n=1 Tax=Roseovarius atlanticus TaxID=1641875 RepID=A0A0T5NU02_9RHOB|nr:hypothetical protein XM53_11680 [Roseovarius atlanticus]
MSHFKPDEGFAENIGCQTAFFKQIRTETAQKQSVHVLATRNVPERPARLGVRLFSGDANVVKRMIVEPGEGAALAVKVQRVKQAGPGAGAKRTMAAAREGGHGDLLSVFVMKHGAS